MATLKQRKVIQLLQSGKAKTFAEAMRVAGYTEATINHPQTVSKSKAFAEYLEQAGITDDKLAKVMNEGLDATKAVVMGVKSDESFVDVQPDYAVRHKYLETSLKMKGHSKETPQVNIFPIALVEFIGDESNNQS